MRLSRNLSGKDLAKGMEKAGYCIVRQKGSHIRPSSTTKAKQHHITIPNHKNLRIGTLSSVLIAVSQHLEVSKEELWEMIKL